MSLLDEILFPKRCPVCLGIVIPWGKTICDTCRGQITLISSPFCCRCGKSLAGNEEEYCTDCRHIQHSFDGGIAGWDYRNAKIERFVTRVKYHNERQLLDYPCKEMARQYETFITAWGLQCLIPIPIHASRQRKRGFNQAEEIANRLGRDWKLPVETKLLKRIRKTVPQKELTERERMKNVAQAFRAESIPEGLYCVGLVDDIYTTGSTMEQCTRVLKQAGVQRVYSIVLSIGHI